MANAPPLARITRSGFGDKFPRSMNKQEMFTAMRQNPRIWQMLIVWMSLGVICVAMLIGVISYGDDLSYHELSPWHIRLFGSMVKSGMLHLVLLLIILICLVKCYEILHRR